jgi:F-type H+-transporting ATPase subunit epsilon
MGQTILVKIFTPSDTILECNALTTTMPGEEGVFGVLPEHSLLIANLQIGVMDILDKKNNLQYFIYGGVAQVSGNEVNVITEFAVNITNIQKTEVMQKITTLKEEIAKKNNQVEEVNLVHDDLSRYESLLTFLS